MSRTTAKVAGLKRLFVAATAAGVALAVGFSAVPAFADSVAGPAGPSAGPSTGPESSTAAGPSAAGLSDAVLRDLGMSLAEFNAAGALGRRAADAAASLQALPGYVGISLKAGKILVEGSGPALQARVNELNQPGPADFVLVAPPSPAAAAAAPGPALVAADIDQLFQDYIRDVGTAGLQAVTYTDGHFVIRAGSLNTPEAEVPAPTATAPTVPAPTATAPAAPASPSSSVSPGKLTPAQFVARYANVQLEKGAAITTEDDVFGGQGYFIDDMAICSAGFGAFSPTGLPLVLTAGHCAEDGLAKAASIEPPASAPAGGVTTPLVRPLAPLGTFGFSQFGGPNNSTAAAAGSGAGTDIAVIQAIAPGLHLQPAATTWGNPGTPDPVRIVGTTAPFQGQYVCRSGRTSGWKCGTVDAVGIWMMPGRQSVPPNYDNDLRPVRAFDSASVKSAGGDSGGPWISGNFAVGTHTGAESVGAVQTLAIAATLEDSLATIPGGVQLQLFLNKPELVAPPNLTFAAGSIVTGRVSAAPASAVAPNSKVRITVAGQQPLDVPVDASGNWSFTAPEAPGTFTFSAETVNGFSRSGAVTLTAIVAPSSLSVPVITTPASAPLPELQSVAGTGTPGSTVTLTGDVAGSGFVGPDGHWSVPLTGPAAFGKVKVTAVLSYAGLADSPAATGIFTVIPPAPAVSSISDGQHLLEDALPATISGSGLTGAEVTVSVDGVPLSGTPVGGGAGSRSVVRTVAPLILVAGGQWSVPFPAGLALGTHTVSVTQAVDGVVSAPTAASFAIDAPAPAVVPTAAGPAAVPTANGAVPPAGDSAAVVRPAGDSLANTGASGLNLAAGLAALVLVIGGVLLALARRRKRQRPTPTG